MWAADDFGAQGGDPARGVAIDLSTCVNRYGPAPAALDARRCVEPGHLLVHPYDAAQRLREVYAKALGVDADELLTSRAVSEASWAMGRTLDPRAVAISLPVYPDYLCAFPGRGFGSTSGCGHSIQQLDAALALAQVVLISNPHHPTGSVLGPDELTTAALRQPRSVLVVAGHWSVLCGYGLGAAVACWLTFPALDRIGAGCTAGLMTFEAITAAALGTLVLGERLGALQAIGGVGILAAAVLIATTRRNSRSSHAQVLIPKIEEAAVS